ncbi:unnamed protein product [Cuscuta campestris]|uniref:Uncharacterized protein n=1 Tax=Cuscuta campestris TaxID=132261 RepID=A0A484LGX4_9ASTE|nr:unnamed protein product [Cuscuta campestris]
MENNEGTEADDEGEDEVEDEFEGLDLEHNEDNKVDDGDANEVEDVNNDAFEGLEMVDHEGNLSSQHGLYHDSISRTYLQELFGNFPSSTDGMSEVQDDQSIGEYEIYEQYGNDDYSEDDDY